VVDRGDYRKRTAVITGGARGFGKAFGTALAERGAHVVLVDLDGATVEETAAAIRAAVGAEQDILMPCSTSPRPARVSSPVKRCGRRAAWGQPYRTTPIDFSYEAAGIE
jgi:NAD(P)-dependent dehydrogenase (short-subunit alcohol dehydrogenase family)